MKKQTEMWCMNVPNHKKNVDKMRLIFVNGIVRFVPK
jgi:hypothetical protein